jgi:hypothetical protein
MIGLLGELLALGAVGEANKGIGFGYIDVPVGPREDV